MPLDTPFFKTLQQSVREYGGFYNAHLHLDRSGTLPSPTPAEGTADADYRLSLAEKHRRFSSIHEGSDFDPEPMRKRLNFFLDAMEQANTRRADTLVDVTPGRIRDNSLNLLLELKAERRGNLDLNLAAYTPMGFRDDEPERWRLFADAARRSDLIGALPERDNRYIYPEHIGFREHCRRVLELALNIGKPLQMHLDQHNDPREHETEIFLDVVDELGVSRFESAEPMVWIIHFISPAHYEPGRRQDLIAKLAELNIGVVCCPSAALSMRQLRNVVSPTGNSIAPVLELLAAGVHVSLGSDNIADICSPAGTPDLMDEMFVLCNAIRFYDIDVLARIATGSDLDERGIALVREHLAHDMEELEKSLHYHPPV